ncbi:MAG: guanine deaminase [Betaproteobacteria bacterium]
MSVGIRGHLVHFLSDPSLGGSEAVQSFSDGVLIIEAGRIAACGPYAMLGERYRACDERYHYPDRFIFPGFVDTHTHFAQTDIIASPSPSLLEWLNHYTFPEEARFSDPAHGRTVAEFFIQELLCQGITTASVFGTVHAESCEAIFQAADDRAMRIIAGKVLMDQNAPEFLCDTAQGGIEASRALIDRWHGRRRLRYSVTPRFIPTSSEIQLELAAALYHEFPDLHLQSHVAENEDEIAWVKRLYPNSRSYLQVYRDFGLLGPRATYAHCIWFDDDDRRLMAATQTAAAFCPTSNLFLGSGLFDLAAARSYGLTVGLATDIGGGTSFSMLRTMQEAYKVAQLKGLTMTAEECFYLATLGGAKALGLDSMIGSFDPGKEADVMVINPQATALCSRRMQSTKTLSEQLFVTMMLGDERMVEQTHILGRPMQTIEREGAARAD